MEVVHPELESLVVEATRDDERDKPDRTPSAAFDEAIQLVDKRGIINCCKFQVPGSCVNGR
jgi:hypothetical protein